MAVFLGAVDGALQAAQHGVVDGVFLGAAVDGAEQFLQLEAVFQAGGLEAEFGDEAGQGVQFARIGVGVHAAQEAVLRLEQRVGDGFVGGQHELFDDLMAFGVFDHVSAGDAAVLVEIDFHFFHRQFQRAAFEAAAAEDHGQFVHAAQQRVHLRGELAAPGFADRPGRNRLLRT